MNRTGKGSSYLIGRRGRRLLLGVCGDGPGGGGGARRPPVAAGETEAAGDSAGAARLEAERGELGKEAAAIAVSPHQAGCGGGRWLESQRRRPRRSHHRRSESAAAESPVSAGMAEKRPLIESVVPLV